MVIVVDASVAYKWLSETEEGYPQALAILNDHLTKNISIIVPDLILYELGNAWSTKSKLTQEKIKNNIIVFEEYSLKIIKIDFNLLSEIVDFSKKYSVTVYDACYAVLAKNKKCDLITADEKFADKLNIPFVKKLKNYE